MKSLSTILLLATIAVPAMAHKASDAYLTLDRSQAQTVLRTDMAVRDIERAIGLDGNGDGRITWGELQTRRDALIAFVRGGIDLRAGTNACPLAAPHMQVAEHTDGAYAAIAFAVRCPGGAEPDTMRYGLLFDIDPLHRGLMAVQSGSAARSIVFAPDSRERMLPGTAISPMTTLLDYLAEGMWHIWIGLDHLLFLAVLLLPAALAGDRSAGRVTSQVIKVVTAFTIAHSITLGLAVFGHVDLPSRWVEGGIAASIVLAALTNLHPRGVRIGWALAFGFGLVHGLGFAGVLSGLSLDGPALALALLGFNLGVEAGQIAVVLAVLPLLLLGARLPLYRAAVLPAGSMTAAMIGLFWLLERMG